MKSKRPLTRIYHRYELWECYHNGMYVDHDIKEREQYIEKAAELLRDESELYAVMTSVAKEWFYSSQNHLSSRSMNRQAWIGQAACCYRHKAGEAETRRAWGRLSEEERSKANDIADKVIEKWEGWHFIHEDTIRDERLRSEQGESELGV